MKRVDCGFSLRSSDNQSNLFSAVFPDSAIARGFQIRRTNTMHEITHGLASYFNSELDDAIGRSDAYMEASKLVNLHLDGV